MRVLVVTTWFPTTRYPATGSFVARDVAALAVDHDVRVLHLVAPSHDDGVRRTSYRGVPVERMVMDPRRPDHLVRACMRLRRLASDVDLLHSVAISSLLPMAWWKPRVRWVHTEHWSGLLAPDTLSAGVRLARPLAARLLSRPDVVTVVSEHLAGGVRAFRSRPVVVVPNIVTGPEVPAPRRPDPAPLRLVSVGGLVPRKGPLLAVRAVAELRRRGVDASLTWVGEGPQRAEVKAEVERTATTGAVHLAGAVPPEQLSGYYATADLFLLPTSAETFCVAAAEALAHGRPVVVGDSGGPAEFVAPPTGELVRGTDPVGYADAVQRVLHSASGLSAAQVAAGVRRRYSAEAYRRRMAQVYAVPAVDVVVAVHDPRRPVHRAVRSVLDGSPGVPVRVSVVAHDVAPEVIEQRLGADLSRHGQVRLLHVADGVPSPSGPFTHGLRAAEAPWVVLLGSDDQLEPGAIRSWLTAAQRHGVEVVVPRLVLAGRTVPTPPVRPLRLAPQEGTGLDLVRDRLSYRSAPLGLLRRSTVQALKAGLLPGARVGGDLPMATRLWTGARVGVDASGPAYLIGEDATDRVTYRPHPMDSQLGGVSHLVTEPWFAALSSAQRRAIGTKLLRINLFGAILTRPGPAWWTAEQRDALARITRAVLDAAPGCALPLSLADRALLDACLSPAVPAPDLVRLAHERRRHGTPRTLLPRDVRYLLHREAPLRFMCASILARR